jgi:hypothetical protein
MYAIWWVENLKGGDLTVILVADARIIFKWILKKMLM